MVKKAKKIWTDFVVVSLTIVTEFEKPSIYAQGVAERGGLAPLNMTQYFSEKIEML